MLGSPETGTIDAEETSWNQSLNIEVSGNAGRF